MYSSRHIGGGTAVPSEVGDGGGSARLKYYFAAAVRSVDPSAKLVTDATAYSLMILLYN
jgi:hypothetical protein